MGQARKSLWIETVNVSGYCAVGIGQARKSLWIETGFQQQNLDESRVRLVRACGSKLRMWLSQTL